LQNKSRAPCAPGMDLNLEFSCRHTTTKLIIALPLPEPPKTVRPRDKACCLVSRSKQIRPPQAKALYKRKGFHVGDAARIGQRTEFAQRDLHNRDVLMLAIGAAAVALEIRAGVRRQIEVHPLG